VATGARPADTQASASMLHILDIENDNAIPLRFVAIPASVEGPDRLQTPAGRSYALVEFYDRRHDFEPDLGQFVSRYFADQVIGHNWRGEKPTPGLSLNGGVPDWSVDGAAMDVIIRWLNQLDERGALV
jgi:hypothetical protein